MQEQEEIFKQKVVHDQGEIIDYNAFIEQAQYDILKKEQNKQSQSKKEHLEIKNMTVDIKYSNKVRLRKISMDKEKLKKQTIEDLKDK